MDTWMEDISRVIERLVALEHDNTDPGTLFELDQQREREQKESDAAPGGKPNHP
jgi:hypothetical protein